LRFFFALAAISFAVFIATLALPYIKNPQSFIEEGPITPYGNSTYTISGYFIPPVDAGRNISLEVSYYEPNSVLLELSPLQGDAQLPPILYGTPSGASFSGTLVSPATQAYRLIIASFNRTVFVVKVSSVWSPFYDSRGYTVPAAFGMMGGIGGAYYFTLKRKKEEIEEQATKQIGTSPSEARICLQAGN
jgi:hypothetical protein